VIARIVNGVPAVIAQRAGGNPASSVLYSATKFCCGSISGLQRPLLRRDSRASDGSARGHTSIARHAASVGK
jgi:hypothetical protein